MKTLSDPRHQARRVAVAYIYSLQSNPEQNLKALIRELKVKKYNEDLFDKILSGYRENKEQLNNIIQPLLKTWSKDQLLDIDIIIIEIATIEVVLLQITPIKVGVDEAVELAKEFGSDKSDKFVNGVLAKVVEQTNIKID